MSIGPKLLASAFCMTTLSGCELILLPLVPVVAPIAYAVEQSDIVQPVNVVSASGERLSTGFTGTAEETFTVAEDATVCNGFHQLSKSTREVSLVCNNELKGKLQIEKFTTRGIQIDIGPKSSPGTDNGRYGYLTEVTLRCTGYFNTNDGRVDPFIIDCGDDGKAAVSHVEGGAFPSEFKVWIHPPA